VYKRPAPPVGDGAAAHRDCAGIAEHLTKEHLAAEHIRTALRSPAPHMSMESAAAASPAFELGLIADAQYGDKPAKNGRTYRESLSRLAAAVEHLNELPTLKAVIHLGDVIDGREMIGESVVDLGAVLAQGC
jgi:hypothetical protein